MKVILNTLANSGECTPECQTILSPLEPHEVLSCIHLSLTTGSKS
ncbi:hypothetical protein [Vibrio mangrovi]|uniref:Uncharacterized protein n=1 Tax=Vibrio mangrovi TaxID=474394 RepID=A0ABU4IB50_9VIBR|nr:hypothetical protein [Vibrio mangrovi]MDW6005188.1 hypothetical protein [Vibrio mangrovi]